MMRYREVEKKLKKLDCIEIKRKAAARIESGITQTKSQSLLYLYLIGGSRDLKTGTLRGIVKDLGSSGKNSPLFRGGNSNLVHNLEIK